MGGISPEQFFSGFGKALRRRSTDARVVLAGSAGERWLEGELFCTLAGRIGPQFAIWPEVARRDLTLYQVKDGRAEEEPVASIELKVVYRTYSESKVRDYIQGLVEQVRRNSRSGHPAFGFLYAVWVLPVGERPRTRETFPIFYQTVQEVLVEECRQTSLASKRLETILEEAEVTIGGVKAKVGMAGQYFAIRGKA